MNNSDKIYNTLTTLFESNYSIIKNMKYSDYVQYQIEGNEKCIDLGTGKETFLMDLYEIKKLSDSTKNKEITKAYSNLVSFNFDKKKIKSSIKDDLICCMNAIRIKNTTDFNNVARQVLFITYDYHPKAWLYMYTAGEFKILDQPSYFDFNFSNELFDLDKTIDFSDFWNPLMRFEEIVDELDLYNEIFNDSEAHQAIYKSYHYQLMLFFSEVLRENEAELLSDFPIIKPFFIYGNEHDREYINLHIIE